MVCVLSISVDSVPMIIVVPCLRRATAVNYTDADEDAEKMLNFMDEVCPASVGERLCAHKFKAEEAVGPDGKPRNEDEDWVATHIGRGNCSAVLNQALLITFTRDSTSTIPSKSYRSIGNSRHFRLTSYLCY